MRLISAEDVAWGKFEDEHRRRKKGKEKMSTEDRERRRQDKRTERREMRKKQKRAEEVSDYVIVMRCITRCSHYQETKQQMLIHLHRIDTTQSQAFHKWHFNSM